ncbi:hypothetical protein ColTof4_11517 [Colletotrichum tofieldiae]|nr:hypothetical protein ColTof3_04708 [Colletotrichum tofieldiae]GKT79094.1 hypothetical protein ColTof4_11517 [Colletotrichum tofieldiae]GKT86683.1 hypothetical protein Ct61P_04533 [Colletotrichum tofieldiae]
MSGTDAVEAGTGQDPWETTDQRRTANSPNPKPSVAWKTRRTATTTSSHGRLVDAVGGLVGGDYNMDGAGAAQKRALKNNHKRGIQ